MFEAIDTHAITIRQRGQSPNGQWGQSPCGHSCTVPVFDQLFLADLIDSGDFERHLNRLRRQLEKIRSSPRLTNIHTP